MSLRRAKSGAPSLSGRPLRGGAGGGRARVMFLDRDNSLFLSAAGCWEICLKIWIGKLRLRQDWAAVFDQEMAANQIVWLPLEKEHLRAVMPLPWTHRDPFDRLLAAQASCEGMAIVGSDEALRRCGVETVW